MSTDGKCKTEGCENPPMQGDPTCWACTQPEHPPNHMRYLLPIRRLTAPLNWNPRLFPASEDSTFWARAWKRSAKKEREANDAIVALVFELQADLHDVTHELSRLRMVEDSAAAVIHHCSQEPNTANAALIRDALLVLKASLAPPQAPPVSDA